MKIVKTKSSTWRGNGFGRSGASWSVIGRDDIRIIRDIGRWYAYVNGKKYVAETKQKLENLLSMGKV